MKITLLTMCWDHFCIRNLSNRGFEAFGFLLPPYCGSKKPTATNALFERFLMQKWSQGIVSKVIFMKNGFSKKKISDPKSAVLTPSKCKIGIFSKGHDGIKNVPIILDSMHHK